MKIISVLVLLLLNPGCVWSDVSDYQRARQRYEEKKLETAILNDQLLGAAQEAVTEVLGKPAEKRKDLYPYLADQSCTGSKCQKKWADEVWFYEFTYKDKSGRHVYSINVYFINGKVVQII